jgi:hypothetical protein
MLEYVKVILAWPVMGPVTLVAVIFWFRSNLAALIDRTKGFKTPFGEFDTSQQQSLEKAEGHTSVTPTAPDDVDEVRLNGAAVQELRQWFQAERAARYIWEYRYLNYFLAPASQWILDWLVGLQQSTMRSAYDAYWTSLIQNAGEREAILHALQMHYLIEIDGTGNVIKATEKGAEYAKWDGRQVLFANHAPVPSKT